MRTDIFIGVDVGATSTTAAAIDDSCEVVAVARGRGTGAFDARTSASLEDALRPTIGRALRASRPGTVGAVVVGLAGSAYRAGAYAAIRRVTSSLGIDGEAILVNDAETMFATGTAASDGYVLAVGTGAIAMMVRERKVAARVDGHGWLFGDHGSAVWMGLAALRAVLGAMEQRSASTSMADDLPSALAELARAKIPSDATGLVVTAHRLPAERFGLLAPLVDRHANDGDSVAQRLLSDAGDALGLTLSAVIERAGPTADLPIVLGGSVIHDNTTIRRSLETLIARRWPNAPLSMVRRGTAGAALWARRQGGLDHDDALLRIVRDQIENATIDAVEQK